MRRTQRWRCQCGAAYELYLESPAFVEEPGGFTFLIADLERAVGAYIRATERKGGMSDEPERLRGARNALMNAAMRAEAAHAAGCPCAICQYYRDRTPE